MNRLLIAIFGMVGTALSGCGQPGKPGAMGSRGAPGEQGPPGQSVMVTTLAAGDAHCSTGGLQVSAADSTTYVCNGTVGGNGAAGQSATVTALDKGDVHCAAGGVQVVTANGTSYVCNGATGMNGTDGTVKTLSANDPLCPNGGAEIIAADGTKAAACNGTNGQSVSAAPILPGDSHCTAGGVVLSGAGGPQYVCNGAQGSGAGPAGPHLAVQTAQAKIGYLVPLDDVFSPMAIFAHKEPGWGIPPVSFPEGWIIPVSPFAGAGSQRQVIWYYATPDCSATKYANRVSRFSNVFYPSPDPLEASMLYQAANTPISVEVQSWRVWNYCYGPGGPAFCGGSCEVPDQNLTINGYALTSTSYQLLENQTPWSLVLQ
jgi:hypothetical protein